MGGRGAGSGGGGRIIGFSVKQKKWFTTTNIFYTGKQITSSNRKQYE